MIGFLEMEGNNRDNTVVSLHFNMNIWGLLVRLFMESFGSL